MRSFSMVAVLALISSTASWADGGIAVPPAGKAEAESECSACHTYLRPLTHRKIEWHLIMTNLSDHMGEDASLPENVRADIEAYLTANASDVVNARLAE
jgi:hypothetical protein